MDFIRFNDLNLETEIVPALRAIRTNGVVGYSALEFEETRNKALFLLPFYFSKRNWNETLC